MAWSERAETLSAELAKGTQKLGDIKKLGAEIKTDHVFALELWSKGSFYPRLLATLIFDRKLFSEEVLDALAAGVQEHEGSERDQLADWLLANQLAKVKKLVALMATWEDHPSSIMRRWFWYHQARLRWTGQTPPGNSARLLESLERDMADAEPEVQWAMNFCAGQIGVHEPEFRTQCVALGEKLGIYKGEKVSKGCTPSYLPELIRIEVAKRQ